LYKTGWPALPDEKAKKGGKLKKKKSVAGIGPHTTADSMRIRKKTSGYKNLFDKRKKRILRPAITLYAPAIQMFEIVF